MAQTVGYASSGFNWTLLIAGVMAGPLLWSILSRIFRPEWFSSVNDYGSHQVGALLTGFGGARLHHRPGYHRVLDARCLLVYYVCGDRLFGSALTTKIRDYKLGCEEEAGLFKALVASLADFHLLPNSLRKLDKV
jgi:hypothetical protein